MIPFAWNGIHCLIPDDWELLQFSKNPEKGRIAFGDRYQLRCEIDWAAVDKPPQLQRMIEDYKAKLITEGMRHAQLVDHHPWKGVTGLDQGQRLTRYCSCANPKSMLLEAIFLWPQEQSAKHDAASEAALLDSFSLPPAQTDGLQEWQALGIHCFAPDVHRLDACIANPADVTLIFTDDRQEEVESFKRLGCLNVWLKTGVDQWLRSLVPPAFKVLSINHTAQEEHHVWTLEATIARSVFKDWWKGRRHFTAAAWICPRDRRLYAATKLTPDYKGGRQPLPMALTCCHQLEITL